MDEPNTNLSQEDPSQQIRSQLFPLLAVLILCGGNGLGMVIGALVWRMTGKVLPAVLTAVVITLCAVVCFLIVRRRRKKK